MLLKAAVLLEERRGDAALRLCQRAVAVAPRSAEAHDGLARCQHALGRDAEGLRSAETARLLLDPAEGYRQGASVYLTLVFCLRGLGRLREALAAAEEGLSRWPDAVLAEWATVVEEELALAEKDRC